MAAYRPYGAAPRLEVFTAERTWNSYDLIGFLGALPWAKCPRDVVLDNSGLHTVGVIRRAKRAGPRPADWRTWTARSMTSGRGWCRPSGRRRVRAPGRSATATRSPAGRCRGRPSGTGSSTDIGRTTRCSSGRGEAGPSRHHARPGPPRVSISPGASPTVSGIASVYPPVSCDRARRSDPQSSGVRRRRPW
jgi:hypothetical protein